MHFLKRICKMVGSRIILAAHRGSKSNRRIRYIHREYVKRRTEQSNTQSGIIQKATSDKGTLLFYSDIKSFLNYLHLLLTFSA